MKIDFTPRELGFYFPAEFYPQYAMWLSWPHKEASWPGKLLLVYEPYCEFILTIAKDQYVCINVADVAMEAFAQQTILSCKCAQSINDLSDRMQRVQFFHHPTNDAWCRDHGPAFVINPTTKQKAIIDWSYNAWGDKYPPYDLDDVIPTLVGQKLGLQVFNPSVIMEGGSVEFNGRGSLLTTTACLLNKNRNPHLTQYEIEQYLIEYYGVEQILWLGDGIVGDDTDGHIDDITRFVSETDVVTVVERNRMDDNYDILQENLKNLKKMRLLDGTSLNVIELPMPKPVIYEDQRLPASYANFYIGYKTVVVPTFRDDKNDGLAIEILQECFPERSVVGIDSVDIIWGLGSFHCLSQQEPTI